MSKKINIECESCGRINEASTSFFSKRKITCSCGYLIDVKKEKMVTKQCPHCGNLIVYNKSKNPDPLCPICKEHVVEEKDDWKFVEVICPECSCHLIANKSDVSLECPLCNTYIDVQERIRQQSFLETKQPTLLKCEKESDVCVWKHQSEDFAFGSQIIVNESQTALFICDGKIVGKYTAGKHMVEKNNLLLSRDNFDEENITFHSQLFFITNVIQINQKWGTDSKVRLFDPATGLHIELGSSGTFNFKIKDYEKFLFYVIGLADVNYIGIRAEEIAMKIRPNIISLVKTYLAKTIKENSINVLEIDEHTKLIGDKLAELINVDIEKFGIEITDFIIARIVTPDDDPNFKRLKQQHAEKYLKVTDENIKKAQAEAARDRILTETGTETEVELARAKAQAEIERIKAQAEADAYRYKAQAEADEMHMKGYTYQDETNRNVSTGAINVLGASGGYSSGGGSNDGIVGLAHDAVKVSIVKAAGKQLSGEILDAMNPENSVISQASNQSIHGWTCKECNTSNITTNFCPNCGTKKPSEGWTCPICHTINITTNFCPNCGGKKPSEGWTCKECNTSNITTNFCPNCGTKKPSETWDCECGQKDIKSNFCPNCGKKKS